MSDPLSELVFAGGVNKPFAEMTADEVRARAQELRDAAGWGPTAKVGPVAMAWGDLGRLMDEKGAATVGDLDPELVADRAQKLWVVPPGGSLLA